MSVKHRRWYEPVTLALFNFGDSIVYNNGSLLSIIDREIDSCFIVFITCSHRLNYERYYNKRHYNKDKTIKIKKNYLKYNNKKVKRVK